MLCSLGMKTKIDVKSALCGLAVGVFAMLAVGAGESTTTGGKYQVVTFMAGGQANALMIDTTTGKGWGVNLVQNWKNDGGNFFEPKEGK